MKNEKYVLRSKRASNNFQVVGDQLHCNSGGKTGLTINVERVFLECHLISGGHSHRWCDSKAHRK